MSRGSLLSLILAYGKCPSRLFVTDDLLAPVIIEPLNGFGFAGCE